MCSTVTTTCSYVTKNNSFQVVLAVEDKLIHWDLSVPKQLKILNLGSVITNLQTDGDVIHCATVGKTALFGRGGGLKKAP